MRRVFSILFALTLVLSLSLVTVPVGLIQASSGTIDVSPVMNISNTGDGSGNGYYERDPQLLKASSGTWYLIYSRSQTSFTAGGNPDALKYDIYYQASTDSGTSWSAATKVLNAASISANANFRSGSICEADGKIWVIGANVESLEGDIYANTYSGGSWSGQSMIFNGTYNTGAFHVDAIAEGNNIRLFYGIQNESNGIGFIKYNGSTDTWDSLVTQIGTSAGHQVPRVINEGSTYYLVSTDWSNILYTSTTAPDITPWPSATSIVTAPSGGAACDPAILKYGDSGGSDDLIVFHAPWYSDDSQPQEYIYSTNAGSTWSSSIPFTDAAHGTQDSWDMMPRAYMKDASTILVFFSMEQRGVNRGQGDVVVCEWDIASNIGNSHYTTIQDGVDNASSGDIIGVSVVTTTGTGLASLAATTPPYPTYIEQLTAVSTPPNPPAPLPYGMFSFKITGLTPGGNVTITVELPGPMPIGTKWWKYYNNSWYPLPIGDDDGDNIITVTLRDGVLPEDSDGSATNGEILDDGGPGSGSVGWETYPINKVRVFLPWIALLAAIAAGVSLLVVRRRGVRS